MPSTSDDILNRLTYSGQQWITEVTLQTLQSIASSNELETRNDGVVKRQKENVSSETGTLLPTSKSEMFLRRVRPDRDHVTTQQIAQPAVSEVRCFSSNR